MSDRPDTRKNSPKRWVALVILTTMAMVLSFVEFPLFPAAPFLKYDPSSIIAIIAALLYSPILGCAVAVLAWVPRLITDPLGSMMNIMSVLPVIFVMGAVYHRNPSLKSAVYGSIVGGAIALVISVTLNYVVIPVFYGGQLQDVFDMTLPVLLPFNLIKIVLNSLVSLVTYRKLEQLLDEGDEEVGANGDEQTQPAAAGTTALPAKDGR